MKDVERIDLGNSFPQVKCIWRNGDPWGSRTVQIVLGGLPGDRWYVAALGWCAPWSELPGCAYAGEHAEHYALATARRWMRTVGGEWVEA
jgi:hypothetical protein